MCAMSTEIMDEDFNAVPSMLLKRMARYRVTRADNCINCGLCESLCPYGVHRRVEGHVKMLPPADAKCIGPTCSSNAFYCVKNCPTQSLSVSPNPVFASMGDPRWTPDMIIATWKQAETGQPIPLDHYAQHANSGGGFDRISIADPGRQGQFPSGGDIHRDRPEPPQVWTAGQDRHPGLRRRHVVRLRQQADDVSKGHSGHEMEHLHLHWRGRLSGHAHPVQGPRHHPDRYRAVRCPRGDHQARPDRGVQVRPGREARSRRTSAVREEHPRGGQDERGGALHQSVLSRSRSTACTRSRTTRSTWTGSTR